MEPTLSIVIPIFNEVASLKELLQQVADVEVGMKKELVLVDDFSTDGTRAILEEIEAIQEDSDEIRKYVSPPQIPLNEDTVSDSEVPNLEGPTENTSDISAKVFYHDVNKGKGATLRTGFQHITGEITLIQDADLEYDPQDYPKLLQPILDGEADVVYGSRFMEGRQTGLLRSYLANQFLTTLANIVNGTKLTDMETCYKVIRTSILKEISLNSDRFGFEPEITAGNLPNGNVESLKFLLPIAAETIMKEKQLAGRTVSPLSSIFSVSASFHRRLTIVDLDY